MIFKSLSHPIIELLNKLKFIFKYFIKESEILLKMNKCIYIYIYKYIYSYRKVSIHAYFFI